MLLTYRSLILILFLTSSFAVAQYPSSFSFVPIPDLMSGTNPVYSSPSLPLPAIGAPFWDPRFGTRLTRATQTDGIKSRHEYSRFDPFNQDHSMIILDPVELWNVYRTSAFPYNQESNLVRAVHLEEPRWDPVNPNLIWGVSEFKIMILDVVTGTETVVKDFGSDPVLGAIISQSPVYRITMKDEGESSLDKRFWVFFLQGDSRVDYQHQYIFTWDRATDQIVGTYKIPLEETDVDWISMSSLGNWVVIGGNPENQGNLKGLVMANKELTWFHTLSVVFGHADVGLDSNGKEVVVGQNAWTDYVDLVPLDQSVQPVSEPGGSYDGTNTIPLVRLYYDSESPHGLQSGVHISCNAPGYCLISTNIEPSLPEQNWLDRCIILVRLDRTSPKGVYLAKIYNTTGNYWEETQATISDDGDKIVWACNWDQNVGQEKVFLMQLDMPPNWRDQFTQVHDGANRVPQEFRLEQNFPNPFNAITNLGFTLPAAENVRLAIFTLSGQEVVVLVDEHCLAGYHSLQWDGRDARGRFVPSGLNLYRLQAGANMATKKMLLLR